MDFLNQLATTGQVQPMGAMQQAPKIAELMKKPGDQQQGANPMGAGGMDFLKLLASGMMKGGPGAAGGAVGGGTLGDFGAGVGPTMLA